MHRVWALPLFHISYHNCVIKGWLFFFSVSFMYSFWTFFIKSSQWFSLFICKMTYWLTSIFFLFAFSEWDVCVCARERARDKMGLIILLIHLPGMVCWLLIMIMIMFILTLNGAVQPCCLPDAGKQMPSLPKGMSLTFVFTQLKGTGTWTLNHSPCRTFSGCNHHFLFGEGKLPFLKSQ